METITIPKQEYNELLECKQIVEIEYNRPLSKKLLEKLKEAQKDISAGKGITLISKEQVQEYFQAM